MSLNSIRANNMAGSDGNCLARTARSTRVHARATDARRLSQPVVAPWNAKGYPMNAIHRISGRVEADAMGTIHVLPDGGNRRPAANRDRGADRLLRARSGWVTAVPIWYRSRYGYDGESIYAHSGPGRKLDLMRAEPRVTFEVDQPRPSDRWRSVIAEGTFEEIADPTERQRALRRHLPATSRDPVLAAQTVVFRIRLTRTSGRYETPD